MRDAARRRHDLDDPDAPRVRDDFEDLLDHVGDPRHWTWVLDFDGTLAPIVDHPDDAVLAPGAWDAVAELAEVCEVALLSGRALGDLRRRLGTVPPKVLLVGGHGSEARLPDGTRMPLTDLDVAREVLDEVVSRLRQLPRRPRPVADRAQGDVGRGPLPAGGHPGRRDAAPPRPRGARVGDGPRSGVRAAVGKAVLELKARGVDKGRALAWIDEVSADHAHRLPGGPPIRPLVFGDDVTDEDGFEAAVAIGGSGVLINDEPAATAASFRLHDPERLVRFLRTVRRSIGERAHAGVTHGSWPEVERELGGDPEPDGAY